MLKKWTQQIVGNLCKRMPLHVSEQLRSHSILLVGGVHRFVDVSIGSDQILPAVAIDIDKLCSEAQHSEAGIAKCVLARQIQKQTICTLGIECI